MQKKLLCLMIVLAMVLGLSACYIAPIPIPETIPVQTDSVQGGGETQAAPTTELVEEEESTLPPATTPAPQPETETIPQPESQPTDPVSTQPTPTIPPTLEPDPTPTYGHTPLSATEYYQYANMTATEKQVYAKLVNALQNLQSEVYLTGISIKEDAALMLFQRVLADHPQMFWVSRSSSVIYDSRTNIVEKYVIQYTDGEKIDTVNSRNNPVIVADRNKIAAKRQAVEEKITQILSAIPANIPEVEREKKFHDYIVANVQYDYVAAANPNPVNGFLPHAFDIYGALIQGKSVCEGYAKLFQYLCYRSGIQATQIAGVADGGGHMWNGVKLDGEWYEIDLTWDDTGTDVIYYGYFNLTRQQMGQDHTPDSGRTPYPQATGTKYCYADYYALKLVSSTQLSDNYKTVLDRLLSDGSGYLIIYKNGQTVTGTDLNTLFYNPTSIVRQYVRDRGYHLELANSYSTYEDYIYIAYTAKLR